jgi:hypothetical protein
VQHQRHAIGGGEFGEFFLKDFFCFGGVGLVVRGLRGDFGEHFAATVFALGTTLLGTDEVERQTVSDLAEPRLGLTNLAGDAPFGGEGEEGGLGGVFGVVGVAGDLEARTIDHGGVPTHDLGEDDLFAVLLVAEEQVGGSDVDQRQLEPGRPFHHARRRLTAKEPAELALVRWKLLGSLDHCGEYNTGQVRYRNRSGAFGTIGQIGCLA